MTAKSQDLPAASAPDPVVHGPLIERLVFQESAIPLLRSLIGPANGRLWVETGRAAFAPVFPAGIVNDRLHQFRPAKITTRGIDWGRALAGGAYISGIFQNHVIGERQGLREKYKGSEWEPVGWERPLTPPHAREARDRSNSGYKIARDQFPEGVAVWEEEAFAKTGDFLWAGPFLTVNAKVADVLRQFDLGEGELVPVPLFKADLETPWPQPYFYINYGGPKDTLLPEQSRNVQLRLKVPETGQEIYDVPFKIADGDIALSATARSGGAVWIEHKIRSRLFMSEELVAALLDTGINVDLRLAKCRIVEG